VATAVSPSPAPADFRPLVITGLILGFGTTTATFTAMALAARILEVRTTSLTPTFPVGDWIISDFGSNLASAALLSCGGLLIGLIAWFLGGFQWAAGLITGSGLMILGWATLVIGLSERPITIVESAVSGSAPVGTAAFTATIQRGAGFTLLVLAALCALVTAILGASRMRPDPQGGLNPWVAALGAVAAMGVVIGPLLPVGSASLADNFSSSVDQPALFVIARIIHVTLIAICAVGGFLLVRTAGLGVMLGPLILVGWLTATVVLDRGSHPIGPGFANPGRFGSVPQVATEIHTVTLISVIALTVTALGACGAAVIRRLAHTAPAPNTHESPLSHQSSVSAP
jgi:hypothetical protein